MCQHALGACDCSSEHGSQSLILVLSGCKQPRDAGSLWNGFACQQGLTEGWEARIKADTFRLQPITDCCLLCEDFRNPALMTGPF